MKRSWETTLSGLGAILIALGSALKAQFDSDPSTVPDWGLVISLAIAGIGLLRARDNNKTSESVGASQEVPISRPKAPLSFGLLLSLVLPCCLLGAGAVSGVGCAAVERGQDPVVVNAERATAMALDVMDAFLQTEYLNRELLAQASPEIHQVAERVRTDGPKWLESARAATKAYKQNRSPENKFQLQTAIAVLQTAVTESQRYIALSASLKPQACVGPEDSAGGPLRAAVPLVPILLGLISLMETIVPKIERLRAAAKQSGELTPEQEAELDARIRQATSQPHWQPGQ